MRAIFLFAAAVALSGCVSAPKVPTVTLKDRNRDGRVDYALHEPRGQGFDALPWAYYDDNFDGYFDRKREFGELMSIVDRVHIPVPSAQFRDTPSRPEPRPTRPKA